MSTDGEDPSGTVIRPRPGGRAPGEGRTAESAAPSGEGVDSGPMARTFAAVNPLVAAAGPVLTLISVIRGTAHEPDVTGVRERAKRELRDFEERAARLQLDRQTLRQARYILAATVDDVAQNTPWGGHNVWASQSMVSAFEGEAISGERVYDVLEHVQTQPASNLWLLELIHLCLALGFQGRLRVQRGGPEEHTRRRDELYRTIRNQRGEPSGELSPRWHGLDVPHRALRRRLPVWVIGAVAAAVLVLAYGGFRYALDARADRAVAALSEIPAISAETARDTGEAAPVKRPEAAQGLRRFLADERDAGLVAVKEEGREVIVRLLSGGMFASGSATLSDRARRTVDRVAQGLTRHPGEVTVEGHTDDIPINTERFGSNTELSEARARAAAERIRQILDTQGRVTIAARGAAEPLRPNDGPENRARNRRIDIRLDPDSAVTASTEP